MWFFQSASKKLEDAYIKGFQSGYEKAWDTILPLISEGLKKSHGTIERHAIDQTLERLGRANGI